MALHGQLAVNGSRVGGWSAQRMGALTDGNDTVSDYRCQAWSDGMTLTGEVIDVRWEGTVSHRYGDGALVLLRKILEAATRGND